MPALVSFVGPVTYRYDRSCPLPLQLTGYEGGAEGTTIIAHFAGTVPESLPSILHNVEVEVPADLFDASTRNTPRTYLLNIAGKRYPLSAARLAIHRDVRDLIETVLPARKVRLRTRLFWRVVFVLMRTPLGRLLLLRRYRS